MALFGGFLLWNLFFYALFGKDALMIKTSNVKKLTLAAVLCAIAVLGGLISFPVLGSRCAPVQHIVNVLCAVLLGPWYGVGVAFTASLLRNLMGIGSLLAFPGSMCGALICGIIYWKFKNLPATLLGEVSGTGVLGGLLSYPIAVAFMGQAAGSIAFYAYVVPFLISTSVGAALGGVIVTVMRNAGILKRLAA